MSPDFSLFRVILFGKRDNNVWKIVNRINKNVPKYNVVFFNSAVQIDPM